jgi:hypothetical protein
VFGRARSEFDLPKDISVDLTTHDVFVPDNPNDRALRLDILLCRVHIPLPVGIVSSVCDLTQ